MSDRAVEIDIWYLDLTSLSGDGLALAGLLDEQEEQRARRFHRAALQSAFRTTRGALRSVLSSYCGVAPERLRLALGAHGKPHLADHPDIHFNLSHSGDMAACAIAVGCELGIDIEVLRPVRYLDAVMKRSFTAAEQVALAEADGTVGEARFLQQWTRKEAYVKARGTGLHLPLDSFGIVAANDGRLCLSPPATEPWRVLDLQPRTGYVGALAAHCAEIVVTERTVARLADLSP